MEMETESAKKPGMNKMLLILGGAVIIILLIGAGVFVFGKKESKSENIQQTEQVIKEIDPEEIGLTLTPANQNRQIIFNATKLDGVDKITYTLSYEAEGPEGPLLRGSEGSFDIASGDYELPRTIDLGSCSSGTCKFDKGVREAEFDIRVDFTNGEVGRILQTVSLTN